MAHLNKTRNVNDPWAVNEFHNQALRELELDVYCGDFRLSVHISLFDVERMPPLRHVDLIALAEYLWRPGVQVGMSFNVAQQTIEYLEATRV